MGLVAILIYLRPQVNQLSMSLESDRGSSYRLDESLMERLMIPRVPGIAPIGFSCLNLQRRMHPQLADLMRATLYPYLQVFLLLRPHKPSANILGS